MSRFPEGFAFWVLNGLIPYIHPHGRFVVRERNLYFRPSSGSFGKGIIVEEDEEYRLVENVDMGILSEDLTRESLDFLMFTSIREEFRNAELNVKLVICPGKDCSRRLEIGDIDCYIPEKELWIELTTSKKDIIDHFKKKLAEFQIAKRSIPFIYKEKRIEDEMTFENIKVSKMIYVIIPIHPSLDEIRKFLRDEGVYIFSVTNVKVDETESKSARRVLNLLKNPERFALEIEKKWKEFIELIEQV